MANNRLYIASEGQEPVLLAKGWSDGWEIWEPETLVARLESFLAGLDILCALGGDDSTIIHVEDENHPKDCPTAAELETLFREDSDQ